MRWKFWQRAPSDTNIVLTIRMTPEGGLSQSMSVPDLPANLIPAAVENTAKLLFLLNAGRLLPVLQKAVAQSGETPAKDGFSHSVLHRLNGLVGDTWGEEDEIYESDLVVRPRDTFGFNSPYKGD